MITIKTGNSYSQISGLDTKAFNKLKKILSYTPESYYSAGFTRPRYLIDARGSFPTGLLNRVLAFLKHERLQWVAQPTSAPKLTPAGLHLRLNGIAPYADQLAAVEAAVTHGRGTISMPTGTGKSLIIALIAARLNVKTLVVVPTLEIKNQLRAAFLAYFGPTKAIQIENIDSKALKTAKGFDCLIVDEAHHVASRTYQGLNRKAWTNIRRRYFLTATPFRNQADEQLLFEGIAGQVIYQVSYKRAVAAGYIVPIEAYYLDLKKTPTEAMSWREVYSELVVHNEARNALIATLVSALDATSLTLVKEISHGKTLSDLLDIPFVNGQDEESRESLKHFNAGKLTQLIGTTGVLGEGVDTKPAEWVIIAGLGKAKSAFMQQCGRAVRTYPGKTSAKIVIIRDPSHRFTLRHFRLQCKILKEEYGVTPIKLEF